jgi:hypothetical protein
MSIFISHPISTREARGVSRVDMGCDMKLYKICEKQRENIKHQFNFLKCGSKNADLI